MLTESIAEARRQLLESEGQELPIFAYKPPKGNLGKDLETPIENPFHTTPVNNSSVISEEKE